MSVKVGQRRTILVPVELDEGALEGFFAELEIVLEEAPPEVILDCSQLDHATSGHINMLWEAQTKCEGSNVPMHLLAVRYGLERVLKVLDLYDLFSIQQRHGGAGSAAQEKPGVKADKMCFELNVEATMNGISVGLSRFHDFLVRAALPGSCAFDLEIVFYEVATNIRRHSGLAETDRIAFNVTISDASISLRFADTGQPFDPTLRTPDFNPRQAIRSKQTHGIGLTMIQRLVDTISYRRVSDRMNVVTLTRKLDWRG